MHGHWCTVSVVHHPALAWPPLILLHSSPVPPLHSRWFTTVHCQGRHWLRFTASPLLPCRAGRTIVFFATKHAAHRAKILFGLAGLPPAGELHGNMSQTARLESLERFRKVGLPRHPSLASRWRSEK